MVAGMKVLRFTKSLCPTCLETSPAQIEKDDEGIWLSRQCPEHGVVRQKLSDHPDQYGNLHDFYFGLIKESYPQTDYIIRTTDRCNLTCPICLASANLRPLPDYPKEKLAEFLRGRKRCKIDLMGAEPTMREDLPQLIRMVEESGNFSSLHTNGIALQDEDFVRGLKEAGLRETHLQFDSLDDDAVYEKIRGRALMDVKSKAIENLGKFGISVDLKVTVSKDLNEAQMSKILDFAAKHQNIKEVFFLSTRFLGLGRSLKDIGLCVPDELIDYLEDQTDQRINRADIHVFQKLYFSFLHMFRVRKCFYNQHYIVRRTKEGWAPLSDFVRFAGLEAKLDRYADDAKSGKRFGPGLRLALAMIPHFLTWRGMGFAFDGVILRLLLTFGFDLSRLPGRNILLGFITACDPFLYDVEVAENCGKGDVSLDLGDCPSGATANVQRDKLIYLENLNKQ
jgi:pyruvate-formate lyase-activating enzyme